MSQYNINPRLLESAVNFFSLDFVLYKKPAINDLHIQFRQRLQRLQPLTFKPVIDSTAFHQRQIPYFQFFHLFMLL